MARSALRIGVKVKFKLETYNDGTPAEPSDQKMFFALSIAQIATILGAVAGVVAAIISIAS